MNELRFVRREERSLILATENDDEFRLVIDDLLIAELKHASRKEREGAKVRPREIQALVRAGKTRAEIAAITGLDESDIERYEEPVLAERRYILERAHAVQVRTEGNEDADQRFGAVIGERLVGLDAEASEWAAWRDEETGWLVSLEFISHDVAHKAVWSFDHRKHTLAPINSDAVNLSKQGDVGDRLIPKLRAVDIGDRTSQFQTVADESATPAANPGAQATPETIQVGPVREAATAATADARPTEDQAAFGTETAPVDVNAEYARRREIDQRAIKSEDSGPADFSQTADLLDALRRRRGERQLAQAQDQDDAETTPIPTSAASAPETPASEAFAEAPDTETTENQASVRPAVKKSRSIWGGAGVASGVTKSKPGTNPKPAVESAPQAAPPATAAHPAVPVVEPAVAPTSPAKKGRASIPSWDDILFGTRSDEDPSTS